jgi:fatty acid desaturase
MLTRQYSDLPVAVKTPDEAYAWRHIVFIIGSIYLLLYAAYAVTAKLGMPWLILFLLPLLGAQIYKVTIIMHDACHFTLLRDRKMNERVGKIAGWFIATDFDSFRRLHWKHHTQYGEPDDPQGDDYLKLENASRFALTWHLLRPLLGYNLFKLVQFGRDGRESEPDAARAKAVAWRDRALFFAGTAFVQLSLAATATGLFSIWWLGLVYPAAAATFALFFSQTRGFAEHVAAPEESPVNHARTHLPNWFDRMLFYTLNFNYHIEHHKFPSVPSCHLPSIHEMMRDDPEYGEHSGSIIRTVAKRWRRARSAG